MKVITLANLTRAINKLKDYFVQIKDAVKSVNGNYPDENGDITVGRVNWAADLESASSQGSDSEFIIRTSGGEASINSGSAWLNTIYGKSEKDGYVPEVLEWEVIPIEREEPITATLDEATFRTYVQTSQDITLTYTTDWNVSPTLYGFTITGTPVAGDQITVHYIKLNLGTITNAMPTEFVSTGWNLFDSVNGYARVINYDGYYRIDGNYSALAFAKTPTSTQTSLSVTDDIITGFPDNWTDGYIIVTGGDNSTTAIYPTWSDWDDGYSEHTDFAVFSKSTIDLSMIMEGDGDETPGLFPYGLMAVGTSRDEINLNIAQATSRIERMTNNETNMAEAVDSGRPFDYDTGYIYIVRETPVVTSMTGSYAVSGDFTVNDHGLEWFDGSEIDVPCQIIYGASLKNKLERNVLTISQQTLTSGQQSQVRTNIGAPEYPFKLITPKNVTENITIASNNSYAVGNLVIVNMKLTSTGNINQNWSLMDMPAPVNNGSLASNNFHTRVFCTDGTSSITQTSMFLLARGSIYSNVAISSGANMFVSVAYLANPDSLALYV